jgi:hypothetical protein
MVRMSPRLRRSALAAALALSGVVVAAPFARAGGTPSPTPVTAQVTDPAGDSKGDAGSDIVSAGFTTTGSAHTVTHVKYTYKTVKRKVMKTVNGTRRTVVVKKRVKVRHVTHSTIYTPDTLLAQITTAGPPDNRAGAYYELGFTVAGCGPAAISWSPGSLAVSANQTALADFSACYPNRQGPTDTTGLVTFGALVSGTTITFVLPFGVVPPQLTTGTVLSDIDANSGIADPVLGLGQPGFYDDARGGSSYTVG